MRDRWWYGGSDGIEHGEQEPFEIGAPSQLTRLSMANNSGIAGLKILAEAGIAACSVAAMSARIGDGMSTWNDGVISAANAIAMERGVKVGITAKEAARLML